MSKLKTGLLIVLIVFSYASSQAQWVKTNTKSGRLASWSSIGIQAGMMNYFGDLNPLPQYISTDIAGTRPGIGVTFNHRFNSRLHGRVGLLWGRLVANDSKAADPMDGDNGVFRYIRNAHFRNDIYELSAQFEYDIFPTLIRNRFYKSKNRIPFTPYITGGIAVFYHSPMAKTPLNYSGPEGAGQWVKLRPLRTEGQGLTRSSDGTSYEKQYSNIQIAFPVGVGVRFKLNNRTHLSFEAVYRYLLTDYLDDVGGNYANAADLPSDLSRAMANRTLEEFSARSEEARIPLDQLPVNNGILLDEFGNPTVNGFGRDGDKRGEGNEDVYLFTGFHLTYIFGRDDAVRCASFGKRR